jgi:uncharacterized iron-regulated protein
MDEKIKAIGIFIIVGIVTFCLGAIGGYCASNRIRSVESAKLTEKYDATARERDATIERITEDNQRLRDGISRAQAQLESIEERASRLEEYNRSAGIGNQQVTAYISGTRQDLEEASRIIERYLGEQ